MAKQKFSVSLDIMRIHFVHFTESLKCFPEKYLRLIFNNDGEIPEHLAYICPLCITNCFMVGEKGIHYTNDFSLDHFPPESAGGRLKVLVCKKCNNESGHKYDFALKEKINSLSFNKKIPLSKISVKTEISNVKGRFHGEMVIREDRETEISFKPNSNKKIPPLDTWLENSKNSLDWKANLTMKIPDDSKVAKAVLKSAYLYCFINWGYDFIYSEQGNLFRQVLNSEAEYPIPSPSLWLDHEVKLHGENPIPRGLCFIQEPKELQSMVVNVPLQDRQTGYNCIATIFIPSPTSKGIDELQLIQEFISKTEECTASFVPLRNFLREKIFPPYVKTWEALVKEFKDGAH